MRDLHEQTLSYPGWRTDKEAAERLYQENGDSPTGIARKKLLGMKNKQRLFQGDRSHPDIAALDSIIFTYKGWQEDKKEAERIHAFNYLVPGWCSVEDKLNMMKRKQAMCRNRSSIGFLKELDSFTFTYPGWRDDKVNAERLYQQDYGDSLVDLASKKLIGMRNKQRLFEGNRSHPEIVALDNAKFTYNGWQEDKKEAEMIHTASVWFPNGAIADKLSEMLRKQALFCNRYSILFLRELDSFTFTYTGWPADKAQAEKLYQDYGDSIFSRARNKLVGMLNKQRLFAGDRSHPEIVALDNEIFTYQGWQEDKNEAERIHTASFIPTANYWWYPGGTVENKLYAMKRKQDMYVNRSGVKFLRDLDSMLPPHRSPERVSTKLTEQDSQKEVAHCVVCMENEPTHAYIPCGHRCVCTKCASSAGSTSRQKGKMKCPVCRTNAFFITKIFL